MSTYAAKTDVPVERSRAELERTITRFGASSFAYASEPGRAAVMFDVRGRRVRFILPMPDRNDPQFTHHSRGKRTEAQATAMWEQACRQAWRALNLVTKAKLEAIEAGISTFDEEFLAHLVLPDGRKVSDVVMPAVDDAYRLGTVPPMLGLTAGGAR